MLVAVRIPTGLTAVLKCMKNITEKKTVNIISVRKPS
jgi:hypothetical protein